MHEDQKPISEYTLEETIEALAAALGAFQTDYGSTANAHRPAPVRSASISTSSSNAIAR